MDFHLFIPITKIDVAKRLVYGTIAEEVPDKAGEIMDYETAKPMFEAWSAEIAKASNGRSVGNLRAMHGSVAAGKLDQIHFDDDARRIATVAKVVDDAEWKKVLEGVYTGFSMGGRYLRRWPDPEQSDLMRYTPEPMEVSLVDHPCIPSATFEVLKSDGTIELRKFKSAAPTNRAEPDVVQGWQAKDGSFHATKAEALKRNASAQERDVSRDTLEFADPGYQPDGKKRYPLDTEAHIRAAWGYIHHDKNQKPYSADEIAKIKAKIVAAWKAKIDKNGPPLAAGKAAGSGALVKNLGDVSQLALLIDDLSNTLDALRSEDGNSAACAALEMHLENLVGILKSLVEQATADLVAGGSDTADSDAQSGASDDDASEDNSTSEQDNSGSDDDTAKDADDDWDTAKVAGRRGTLRKALSVIAPRIDAVSARLDALNERLEHIEAQPMPGGPLSKTVLVTKAQDLGGASIASADPIAAFQLHLEALPADKRAHLLTKLALRNPVTVI